MLLVNASSAPSRIHRLGLFANEPIPAGHKVAEYREGFDLALTEAQVAVLPQAAREQFLRHAFHSKALQSYICDGDDGRFTNHSDRPNSRQIGMASFALCDIPAGTEITLDYGALDGDMPPVLSTDHLPGAGNNWLINGESGFYLDRTDTGWGVFSAGHFAAGEILLRFTGPDLTLTETLALGHWSMYPIQYRQDRYCDCRGVAQFLNHSCEPNAAIRDFLLLVARHPIRLGEQIVFDYSTCMSGDPEAGMPCRCGSSDCRGTIGNFEDLPVAIQRAYLAKGHVSEFIAERHRGA